MTREEIAQQRDELRQCLHEQHGHVAVMDPVPAVYALEALALLDCALATDEPAKPEVADVVDWLAVWVRSGGGRVPQYVLEAYLRESGYGAEAKMLRAMGERVR